MGLNTKQNTQISTKELNQPSKIICTEQKKRTYLNAVPNRKEVKKNRITPNLSSSRKLKYLIS